jgi:hypothetical protein
MDRQRRRSSLDGLVDEHVPVDMKTLDRHKEVARFYGPRVVGDARDLDIAIAFEAGARHSTDEVI